MDEYEKRLNKEAWAQAFEEYKRRTVSKKSKEIKFTQKWKQVEVVLEDLRLSEKYKRLSVN